MSGVPDEKGSVGVFRRAADGGEWQHVLKHLETHTVFVHPTDPSVVFAGTMDGVWRSTDRGATFQRANFPDKGKQIWSFLVDSRDAKRIYAGGSPVDIYRSDDCGAELAAPAQSRHQGSRHRALRRARHAHGAAPHAARRDLRRAGSERRHPHHQWRRDLGGLQRRPDPPVGAAASQEQDRQRHLRRGHAGRARHHHQPGRPRRGGARLPHGPVPLGRQGSAAGRTWR